MTVITIGSTPNNVGVTIQGDFFDFDQLYDALHEIVGEEEEYPLYSAARLRILALCYDLRHANMGHRGVTFVFNGFNDEIMRWREIVAPDKNLYLSINVFWPELLFYTMALNDFARLHAQKLGKNHRKIFEDKNVIWDPTLAQIRMFQAAIFNCIEQTVPSTVLARIRNMMLGQYVWFGDYATQYLDILNLRFLDLKKESRAKNISIVVKRLVEQGDEYQEYRAAIDDAADTYDCSPEDIRLDIEYPEEIEW